ncbi:substrate import-associated zinc metallohydrolase lipoprotein [Hyunsoonleella sp. 2307UL5-6]|uniref:substrate import-associated zinc metallohydrolase lipoprotein n=1 Tax=Hyunsoonleella sp. 2307UL5-6 TaxID=3384768 RepID=UPI0039BC7EAC
MKNIYFKVTGILFLCAAFTLTFTACENEPSLTDSQIDTSTPMLNELDVWLRDNFVEPYNIEIQYKWDINDTDVDRFLHPPFEANVRPLTEILKKVWIEPHNQLGGENFIKNIAPREFILAGGFNFNPGGNTITLGIAEQGARITLFNVDLLDFDSILYEEDIPNDFDVQFSIIGPLSTIHHEYGHILNQIEPYDPVFDIVNPNNYTSSWADRSNEEARELGYISAYASSQPSEDFVEMVAYMLTRSNTRWENLVNSIANPQAIASIREKERIIVDYYQEKFNINFYELQELSFQALLEI